jgi:hypothetical protein
MASKTIELSHINLNEAKFLGREAMSQLRPKRESVETSVASVRIREDCNRMSNLSVVYTSRLGLGLLASLHLLRLWLPKGSIEMFMALDLDDH